MEYDFLSFIDSKAVREYNRDHAFTPAEQSVIITHSFGKTLDEKIAALEYLYSTYSEEEFGDKSVGCHMYDREKPFRTRLYEYITALKKALDDRSITENCIYVAGEMEKYDDDYSEYYFSDYQKAYEFLEKCFDENQDGDYVYEIKRVTLNTKYNRKYTYNFDNRLRLIFADTDIPNEECELDISEYYVNIPMPFRAGDLIKNIDIFSRRAKDRYYVAPDPDEEWKKQIIALDYTDMYESVYGYFREYRCKRLAVNDDKWHNGTEWYYYEHEFPLHIDYCELEELDKVAIELKYLSAALCENDGYYNTLDLLLDYSNGLLGEDWKKEIIERIINEQIRNRK